MDAKQDPVLLETVASTDVVQPPLSSPSIARISSVYTVDEGRFVPGTLIAGRYRVIGLLGRGGMGEVYRATDLTLGQSVALKFLPETAVRNQALLERFHGEVRVARQVSHPNVCRVYDIGEVDGTPFISMEYVDGEDLASLLQRIGRLPASKALEVARKICAGLAAAHDRGIIHRDLKPQNIMLNKRGEVLIMDFGLAGIANQLSGAEVRNGTPAYMAPEQLKGSEVTAKSDIYALGLVLYELFTGKRPYEAATLPELISQQESAALTSMTSIASDTDPSVEKVIRRCLDPDPARRPPSALGVSAALPGGDVLAAALAAGETPSPELVASAGKTEGLERRYSVPALVIIFLSIFGVTLIRDRGYALHKTEFDRTPEVLARDSREIARTFGYDKRPVDSIVWLSNRTGMMSYLNKLPEPRKWTEWLAAEPPVVSEYREATAPLMAKPFGNVTESQPPLTSPGMVRVKLDGRGRLLNFIGVPYGIDEGPKTPVTPEEVFRAAGLEGVSFTETQPTLLPPVASDQIRAWKGLHPQLPNTEVTVEIASLKGRITQAKVSYPYEKGGDNGRNVPQYWSNILLFLAITAMFFTILLARRNWRAGRVDRRGALRVAAARALLALATWMGSVHFVPSTDMIDPLFAAMADWFFAGALLWVLYLALEPALRSRWPHSIVTWNRLLAGRFMDAQVGAHILIGAATGVGLWVIAEGLSAWVGPKNSLDSTGNLNLALGTRQWIGVHAQTFAGAMVSGFIIFFCIFGLKMLVRKDIVAAILAAVFFTSTSGNVFSSQQVVLTVGIYILIYSALIFILLRLGLVASMASMYFLNSSNYIVLGADWTTWYAPSSIATMLLLLSIAIFAFWRSLGSRELLGSD